jgi:uncharacterized protein YxjI
MGTIAAPGEQYTIRRKFWKFLGASFFIDNAEGNTIGYCKQKAFRIREDIRIYTDESQAKELIRISTKSIWDISGTYEIFDAQGTKIGAVKRKGIRSTFIRDEWDMLSPEAAVIGTMKEDSTLKAILRRLNEIFALILPERFHLRDPQGRELAVMRQHFNPFLYRLGISIKNPGGPGVDDGPDELLILALACVVAAIEGRQQGG